MIYGDKAIVLLDEALELERFAIDLKGMYPIDELHTLYTNFLFDLINQLVNLSSTSVFLFTENYLDRNRWFGAFAGRAELRSFPSKHDATLHVAESLFFRRVSETIIPKIPKPDRTDA
jgi:hypothetical protein